MVIQSLTHFQMQEEIKDLQFTSLSTIQPTYHHETFTLFKTSRPSPK